MDEAHYLNDSERGVVWEEVLIYLPPRVRLLLLSATVGNPKEIRDWLVSIRSEACEIVESTERPVPLYPLCLLPDGRITPLLARSGLQNSVQRYLQHEAGHRNHRRSLPDFIEVLEGLRGLELLPAIFFLKSRADCDRAAESFAGPPRSSLEQDELWASVEPFLRAHPILRGHRQFKTMLRHRVASHHAGQLPQWKLLVEQVMNMGYLDAIFSTSTVAAGVDFPARTVVLVQSDRYNGRGFSALTATELQQMTGRAGRRGKDLVGFALFLPGLHQDIRRVAQLMRSRPDGIQSQIQINFSMVLNLLTSHHPEEIYQLLKRSLAAYQHGHLKDDRGELVKEMNLGGGLGQHDSPGAARPGRRWLSPHGPALLAERLVRGRLFLHRDGALYAAFRLAERRGKPLCMAQRLGRDLKVRKGRVVLRGIPLAHIQALLERRLDLPEETDAQGVRNALEGVKLSEPMGQMLSVFPEDGTLQHRAGPSRTTQKPGTGGAWTSFLRHLQFLREAGFVDGEDRLTADGRWASRLRLDHPILVAEAIRQGVFEGRPAPVLAGLIAPFVTDREREVSLQARGLEEMADAFDALMTGTQEMGELMAEKGFPTPVLQFWPAAALCLWAKGASWAELRAAVAMDEGDLVSLIVRTADHLRQVCNLAESHPHLVRMSRMALQRIQREPAIYL
jgi:ATP-dependent RNA helicase HelY